MEAQIFSEIRYVLQYEAAMSLHCGKIKAYYGHIVLNFIKIFFKKNKKNIKCPL